MATAMTSRGVFEFVFGGLISERDELLRFWAVLGFTVQEEGGLSADTAMGAYGHGARLVSIRLQHAGCDTFGTGFVRLQLWEHLANDGMGNADPIVTGSRWMGMYTHDILQLRDSFESEQAKRDWDLWVSPLVTAPLMNPPPVPDFYTPFVGLRETLVFGKRFRLAFIQRGGFDRPGFGTFDDGLPFKNTEGSHANIVQPDNSFSTDFYKRAFDFETAPYGDAHDSGDEPPTIAALKLRDGEMFHVERTRAKDCPSGLLQVYSSYVPGDDLRDLSRPGSGNLCAYSVRVSDLSRLTATIDAHADASHRGEYRDEFGNSAVCFDAPDGYTWIAVSDVE
jgi:hypothetical protein